MCRYNKEDEIFRAYEEKTVRELPKEEHNMRSKFARDRDRVLYSKSFRRLEGKTQVFVDGYDDHIRNRLTHTLEVSQIARTITKALGLNEELAEAIALGHDLGHTPFGHIGERTLNYIMSNCDIIREFKIEDASYCGFKHNYQGIRVVRELENYDTGRTGLNLTKYTVWGMLNHSSLSYRICKENDGDRCTLRRKNGECHNNKEFSLSFYNEYKDILSDESLTIEALIVGVADEIAQRHHDVEDALESGVIKFDNLYEKIKVVYEIDKTEQIDSFERIKNLKGRDFKVTKLGSFLVNFLTKNVIDNISGILKDIKEKYDITSREKFEDLKKKKDIQT